MVVSQLIERKRIHGIFEVFAELIGRGYEGYTLFPVGSGEKEEELWAALVYTRGDNNMVFIVKSIAAGTPVVTTNVPYCAAYIRQE